MIAKSDLLILTIASGLLLFTLMRTGILEPGVRTSAPMRPATQVAQQHTDVTSTAASSTQGQEQAQTESETRTPIAQTETTEATQISSESSGDFKEPDVIREAAFRTHIVKSGEYLGLIAKRYNTSVSDLRKLNNLKGSTIFIGQQLVYAAP